MTSLCNKLMLTILLCLAIQGDRFVIGKLKTLRPVIAVTCESVTATQWLRLSNCYKDSNSPLRAC